MTNSSALKPATVLAQALGYMDPVTGAVVPPLHPATTYERSSDQRLVSGRLYSRADNPTYDPAEAVLTQLEGGQDSLLFSSGMAAASTVFMALAPDDHVLVPKVIYWAFRSWLLGWATRWGLLIEQVDMTDPSQVRKALRPGKTALLWLESPANPTLDVSDIAALAEIAHAGGARLVVDSTFATPILTQPLALGADIVMHSATKYLNGHSDVIAGTLTTRVDDAFWQRCRQIRVQSGNVPGPFEAWLLLRGMRTLHVRVAAQCRSAQAIAGHFEHHSGIAQCLYPGLPSFAGHVVASRQMTGGFGGMLSLRIQGGAAGALACTSRLRLWKRATSLGGVESLVEHRASVEGPDTPTPPDLLRLSVGLEDPGDLIADLEQALTA